MKIIRLNEGAVLEACKIIKSGGLIVAPSDTVYGLLADATNGAAVKKLIAFKNRPWGKPISVFVSDFSMLGRLVKISKKQKAVLSELLPGPFTVILPGKQRVSKLLESEKGMLGVRIPDYSFINKLLHMVNKPITATSANLSGRPAHYNVETLLHELPKKKKDLVDLIVDAGTLPRNKPSTVIDLTNDRLKIIRQGDIIFSKKHSFVSDSPHRTKEIARFTLKKQLTSSFRPLVFIIEGELGVGKTVFVKGIGEYLGIENIISPTFTVSYEYDVKIGNTKKLVHFDLYNIIDPQEFKYLGIETYLKKGNILCFEWGEKTAEILNVLKKKAKIIFVKMQYINEKKREIAIKL